MLIISICISGLLAAQSDGNRLRVGIAHQPPLSFQTPGDVYDGLSVRLWSTAAAKAGLQYDYVPVLRDSAMEQLRKGDIDVFLTATVGDGTTDSLLKSPIYYSSTLAVATLNSSDYTKVVRGLFQPAFFKIIAGLSVLLLIIGTIIYLVERKPNEEQFGGKVYEGIGAGFWWAGVTLTTIGYGDKAPVSFLGRLVAMLWMLVGLAVSATLTAALVSLASGTGSKISVPGDLTSTNNVIVLDHDLVAFLDRMEIPYEELESLEACANAVKNEKADHMLATEMEIDYFMGNHSYNLSIQGTRLEPTFYSIAYSSDFRQNNTKQNTLDSATLQTLASGAWIDWLDTYIPTQR